MEQMAVRTESRFQPRKLSGLPQVRHGEWSRTDASDIDGLSREAEWTFFGESDIEGKAAMGSGERAGKRTSFK